MEPKLNIAKGREAVKKGGFKTYSVAATYEYKQAAKRASSGVITVKKAKKDK